MTKYFKEKKKILSLKIKYDSITLFQQIPQSKYSINWEATESIASS
jgi:hypothetical protein